MQSTWPLNERIMQNLQSAIERLNDDFERVEFWAAAMDAFIKPIPGYETADDEFLLRRKE